MFDSFPREIPEVGGILNATLLWDSVGRWVDLGSSNHRAAAQNDSQHYYIRFIKINPL